MDFDNKPFIWRKKYEEQGVEIDDKIVSSILEKREENKIELQKIKERQRKRELEHQQKLNDSEFLQRQKEAEQHQHWEQQEDDFVIGQHRHRSKIRIRDGRAKTIDLLAHYIDIFGARPDSGKKGLQEEKIDLSDSPVELLNPCDWFNGLRQSDLEALEPDIKIYMNADCEQNQHYWKDLLEITQNELSKLSAKNSDIDPTIVAEVMSLFEGKTISELDDLEEEMSDALIDDEPSIDVPFYQCALSRLRAYRAKMRLTLQHKTNLKRELQKREMKKEEDEDKDNEKNEEEGEDGKEEEKVKDNYDEKKELVDEDDSDREQQAFEESAEEYSYSPKMFRKNQLHPGTVCVNYEEEYEILVHQRNQVCGASTLDEVKMATMSNEERAFMAAASKGMDSQEESTFSCETTIRPQTHTWADKYQPRKPRYFNRVHTGFEWNKYNQTHYDIDNPPPKVVQGYKFNIFYPDLVDKSKAPTFTLTPCKEDKDFCIIRFSAGPPYEDIAFRIVNREWNNSHKSGYRCQFINNMLQLWFQFKRYRYRR